MTVVARHKVTDDGYSFRSAAVSKANDEDAVSLDLTKMLPIEILHVWKAMRISTSSWWPWKWLGISSCSWLWSFPSSTKLRPWVIRNIFWPITCPYWGFLHSSMIHLANSSLMQNSLANPCLSCAGPDLVQWWSKKKKVQVSQSNIYGGGLVLV